MVMKKVDLHQFEKPSARGRNIVNSGTMIRINNSAKSAKRRILKVNVTHLL